MSSNDDVRAALAELLAAVPEAPQSTPKPMQGRAVGRTESSLRLATASGVVDIPVDEIADLRHLKPDDRTMVSLVVRDASRVRQVIVVSPQQQEASEALAAPGGGGAGGGGGGGGGFESDTYTSDWTDTQSISFGRLDDTVDAITRDRKDDFRV
jgi:hypothetical protein